MNEAALPLSNLSIRNNRHSNAVGSSHRAAYTRVEAFVMCSENHSADDINAERETKRNVFERGKKEINREMKIGTLNHRIAVISLFSLSPAVHTKAIQAT